MKGFNYTFIGISHILTEGMYFKQMLIIVTESIKILFGKIIKKLLKHHFCNIKVKMASWELAFEGNELEELYQTEQ